MEIIQRNKYAIEVNGKLIVKSLDRNEWFSDDYLTIEEHQAFMTFISELKNSNMKIARTLEQVEKKQLALSVTADPYIKAFTQSMIELSNDLNGNDCLNVDDIKEGYLPAIREFILNITGL